MHIVVFVDCKYFKISCIFSFLIVDVHQIDVTEGNMQYYIFTAMQP